nr:hypothetical protein [Wolbachia endosymbiont of Wuchereria bancrofti]
MPTELVLVIIGTIESTILRFFTFFLLPSKITGIVASLDNVAIAVTSAVSIFPCYLANPLL